MKKGENKEGRKPPRGENPKTSEHGGKGSFRSWGRKVKGRLEGSLGVGEDDGGDGGEGERRM